MRRSHGGFALPVVLLFVALIAGLLMSSAAYSMIGAKRRSSVETTSTMALFAAESLLAKIDGQMKDQPLYQSGLTAASAQQQLTTWGLNTLTLDNTATATVTVANVTTTTTAPYIGRITLKSQGAAGGATKHVLKDYVFTKLANGSLLTGGALVSFPGVTVSGTPSILGEDALTSTGIAYDADLAKQITLAQALTLSNASYTSSQTITLADPRNPAVTTARIDPPPTYIDLTNNTASKTHQRFKVTQKTDTTLTITPIKLGPSTSLTATYAKDTPVGTIPLAVTGTLTMTTATTQTIPVTDPSWFSTGQTVAIGYVNGSTPGNALGVIQSVDKVGKSITVSFTGTDCRSGSTAVSCSGFPAGATVYESTPIRQNVVGVTSSSSIGSFGNAAVTTNPNNTGMPSPYGTPTPTCPSGDLLFCSVFGIDRDLFKALNPPQNLTNLSNLSGLTVINGGTTPNGANGICGSGVLVIFGDVTINNSNCASDPKFVGLIYVAGNLTSQGNVSVAGSVVAEGTATGATKINGNNGTTGGNGKGNGAAQNDKIIYSLTALNDAAMSCCSYTTQTVAGSWRQQ